MPITTTSDLTAGILQKIQDEYLIWATKAEVYGQFVNWKPVPVDGGGASAFRQVVGHRLERASTVLSETGDVTPVTLSDSYFDITPYLYGNAVALSLQLRYQSHIDELEKAGETLGRNRAESVDFLIRAGILGATAKEYPGIVVARTSLDATNDLPTYAFLNKLVAYANGHGFTPYEGGHFVSVIHPLLANELRGLAQWQDPGKYRTDQDGLFNNEVGMLSSIRFIEHEWGKVYLSGGTVGQAATTVATEVAAGATTVVTTSATGIVAGDSVTLGTLEAADAEQVQVISVDTNTLTVKGIGNTATNFGCKYAHAVGAAVTEAANVGAIPLFGKNAIYGRHGSLEGRYGVVVTKEKQGVLEDKTYIGWRWYGGVNVFQKAVVVGEVAVSGGWLGIN